MLPAERKEFPWVTASVAPSALGLFSRPKAWRQGVGLEAYEENPVMRWGTLHEEDALYEYECATGLIPSNTLENQRFFIHPRYAWLGATPDGLIGDQALVEFKCPMNQYDAPKPHHLVQTQVQLAVTGRLTCDLATWTPESFRIWRIARSHEFFESIKGYLYAFYRALRELNEPPRFRRKPNLDYGLIAVEEVK